MQLLSQVPQMDQINQALLPFNSLVYYNLNSLKDLLDELESPPIGLTFAVEALMVQLRTVHQDLEVVVLQKDYRLLLKASLNYRYQFNL